MLSSTDLSGERRSSDRPDLLLTATFYLLFLVQLLHHQLWRDELNAFGLALASPTLGSLFNHLRYEGHPGLWYVLLWVAGRATSSVAIIKIMEACIVAATYGLLGLRSPFSRIEKTVLFLSYFVSFEYAVLSRMYSLLLLFLLLYLWQRREHPERVIRNCLLLAFMPSTDTMGLILSMTLLVEYGVSSLFAPNRIASRWRPMIVGIGIYTATLVSVVWCARPAPDMGWRTTGRPLEHLHDGGYLLLSAVSFIVMPLFPVGFGPLSGSFWNPMAGGHPTLYLVSLPLVLIGYVYILRQRRLLLLLLSFILLLAVLFGHLVFLGAMRHWGVTFLAFLAALWLLKRRGKPLSTLAVLLLGLNALCGIYTGYAQWRRPFSNAETAATWLREHHLENMAIAGTPDTTIASLAVLLHRPVYMLDCNCADSYALFSKRRDSYDRGQIPDRMASARRNFGKGSFLYIDAYPVSQALREAGIERGYEVEELAAFTGAIAAEEDFYIYRIREITSSDP